MSGYRLVFHPAIRKDLRKLPKQAATHLVDAVFPEVARAPFEGTPLHGELRGIWKWVAHYGGVSYRVVYEADTNDKTVYVLSVGARGGFYERLRRRLR